MTAKSLTVHQIREILRLKLNVGVQSTREIAQFVGIGKTSVGTYLKAANRLQLHSFAQVSDLSDRAFVQVFQPLVNIQCPEGRISLSEKDRQHLSKLSRNRRAPYQDVVEAKVLLLAESGARKIFQS